VKGQHLLLTLRPEDIALHLERPDSPSNGNLLDGEVIDTVYLGNFLECRVRVGSNEINIQIDHYEQLSPQQKEFQTFDPDHALCLTE